MTSADDTPPDRSLPPSLELAWGLREAGTRGPRRGLTLERIVAAGIALAGAGGVENVSMAKVAAELGMGTMSLYRYVAAKDELLALMVDAGLGAPPQPADGEDWRAGLTRWATALRGAYRSHPWSLRVPISGPPLGPNNVAWLDNALAAMHDTPLPEDDKLSTVLLLSGFVRNEVTLGADLAAGAGADGGQVMPGYGELIMRLTDPATFPALHQAIASGSLDDDDDFDKEFDFGLARILDGVAVLIDRAR